MERGRRGVFCTLGYAYPVIPYRYDPPDEAVEPRKTCRRTHVPRGPTIPLVSTFWSTLSITHMYRHSCGMNIVNDVHLYLDIQFLSVCTNKTFLFYVIVYSVQLVPR